MLIQDDYAEAIRVFAQWARHRPGIVTIDADAIMKLQEDIDVRLVEQTPVEKRWLKERFPRSLQLTYRAICERNRIVPDERDLEQAYQLGFLAYNEERWKQRGLVPDVAETLDFLVAQDDELLLMSKGDERLQNRKFEINGLYKWFGEIHVVPEKTHEAFRTIVGRRDRSRVCAVGDSIRSDIIPACDAGIGGVYIPPPVTWKYENTHDGLPNHPRVLKLDAIGQIQERYDEIMRRQT